MRYGIGKIRKVKEMKKILSMALATTFIFSSMTVQAADIQVYIDGNKPSFTESPIIQNGTTLVPMRELFQSLGTDVQWNQQNKSITATYNGRILILFIGKKEVEIDGNKIALPAAPVIKNDTTFVPIRIIGEFFDQDVQWDADTSTVQIKTKQKVIQQETQQEKPKEDYSAYWKMREEQDRKNKEVLERAREKQKEINEKRKENAEQEIRKALENIKVPQSSSSDNMNKFYDQLYSQLKEKEQEMIRQYTESAIQSGNVQPGQIQAIESSIKEQFAEQYKKLEEQRKNIRK